MFSFKPVFSLSSFTLLKRLFSFSSLSTISVNLVNYNCQGASPATGLGRKTDIYEHTWFSVL